MTCGKESLLSCEVNVRKYNKNAKSSQSFKQRQRIVRTHDILTFSIVQILSRVMYSLIALQRIYQKVLFWPILLFLKMF